MKITVAGIAKGRMRHLIVDGHTACGHDATELLGPRTGEWGAKDENGMQIVWNCRLCDRAARRNAHSLGLVA